MQTNIQHIGVNQKKAGNIERRNLESEAFVQGEFLSDERDQFKVERSKESLYNELLNSFDFSMKKDEKTADKIKQNANQTQSTMSLFSNNVPVS